MSTKKGMTIKTLAGLLLVIVVLLFILLGPRQLLSKTLNSGANFIQKGISQEGPYSTIPRDVPLAYSKKITTRPGIPVDTNYFGQLQSTSRTGPVSAIVLHHTGGKTASGAIDALRKNGYSVHYMIGSDGTIYYLVDESREAFHCGCCPQDQPSCCSGSLCITCVDDNPIVNNENSIGIEIVNTGNANDDYTNQQYTAISNLLRDITRRQGIPYDNAHIVAHYQITVGKWDPSPNFDWDRINLQQPDLPSGQTIPSSAGYS